MMKKLLTALVVALLLLALPVVVLAEASGTCGDNLTWTLTDDGVLSISGEGWMNNFKSSSYSPWNSNASSITSIVIENGVLNIGNSAFGDCINLTSVSIPDSVTQIGSMAFDGCTSLSTISVPDAVTQIGDYAFSHCPLTSFDFPSGLTQISTGMFSYSAFTSFTVPEHITSIGGYAFFGCENLSSVNLHNSISMIGYYAFVDCPSLKSVYLPDDIVLDASAFGSSATILYVEIGSATLDSLLDTGYRIYFRDPDYPDFILCGTQFATTNTQFELAGYANPDATHVVVPDEVIVFYRNVFENNTNLVSITLPNSVTEICPYAFSGCTSLETIVMDGVTSIGNNAFSGCTSLTGILEMPESLTTLQDAFNGCTNLSGILLPDHVTEVHPTMPDYYANRESETALGIGSSSYLYWGFIDPDYPELYLRTHQTEDGELYYEVAGAKPTITTLTPASFPEGTTKIGMSAFSWCDKLTSVILPESITVLDTEAFYRCSQLKSVTLHDKMTEIHWYAFAFSGIESIYLPGSIGEVSTWLFQGCESLKYVTLGEGITSIKDYAFGGVTTLEQIYIPSSVISIGEQSGSDVVPLPGQNVTMQFTFMGYNTDVYCYEYSYAEHWGNTVCRQAILLDGKDTDEITNVTLPESMTTTMGLPIDIPCTIFPVTNDQVVTWVSSNPAVARVDANGRVTPLKPGSTTITLTVDSASASCEVTVYPALKSLTLPETVYAVAKEGVQLPLRIIPADAACDFTYTIADANFGSISSTGWITAATYITTPSTTTLTVTDSMSGKTVTTQLCITYPVTAISFAQPTVDVACGAISLLTANVTMRSDSCVNQLVTFTSSDPAIATVDSFGYVTGLKQGSVTITATSSSGVSATCTVNITAPGLPGDVSGDQTVALDDALALLTDLIDPAVTDFPDVADVDKDTIVDQYDVLLLVQYLSGWDVELK